jgi:murein DD-endopeptidase MepM/ murein hydrolase activator NlpD
MVNLILLVIHIKFMAKLLFIILILLTISKTNIVFGQIITIPETGREISYRIEPINNSSIGSPSKDRGDSDLNANPKNDGNFNTQSGLKQIKSVCLPLSGKLLVTSGFGERFHPILSKESLHTGIDLRAGYEIVHAIAQGIIMKQGYDARSGNFVVIYHGNGIESIYCHLSKFLKKPGAIVLAGDELGVSGETGVATGPHLHFAIKENGKYIDPLPLIQAIDTYNKIGFLFTKPL